MDASNIINLALLLVTAIGVFVAIYSVREARVARGEALAAQNASEEARDESVALAREATTAFVRSAAAQEEANEIARLTIPRAEVQWALRNTARPNHYEIVNVGSAPALDAVVRGAGNASHLVRPETFEPQLVRPNDGLGFAAYQVINANPVIRVAWRDSPGGAMSIRDRTLR